MSYFLRPKLTIHLLILNVTFIILLFSLAKTAFAANFYVSPGGSSSGNGSISNPWDIQTALNQPAAVKPGDTINLRGGTYGSGGSTRYTSNLIGTSNQYITIKPYANEQVRINGGFAVYGEWVIFRDLEVMNSDTTRITTTSGSHPTDIPRLDGFLIFSPYSKFINNVVHNTRQGFGFWSEAQGSELYGNIVFNSGWDAPDRGHGHGIYSQNRYQSKLIRDNIVFNNFGEGIQLYGSTAAYIKNYLLQGNVIMNNISVIKGGTYSEPIDNVTVENTYIFQGALDSNGADTEKRGNITIKNSVISRRRTYGLLYMGHYANATVEGNIFHSGPLTESLSILTAKPNSGNWSDYTWNNNHYYHQNSAFPFRFVYPTQSASYSSWLSTTDFDANSTYLTTAPPGTNVYVRPNLYQTKRGHIIIFNWNKSNTVNIDVSSLGLQIGDNYTIRSVQNYYEDTPITGAYSGSSIAIDMRASRWSVAKPIGYDTVSSWYHNPLQPTTFPEFGAFILTLSGSSTTPTASPTATPTPTSRPATPTPTPTLGVCNKPGDANGDCKVDGFDYVIWWMNFGNNLYGSQNGDFNNDGRVDGFDYIIWWQNFGR